MSNRAAFLTMLAFSEGTLGKGDNGYNVLFGGGLFSSYLDHPRRKFYIDRLGIYTSAAGRYQIIAPTFDDFKGRLNLPDFSPASQDACALALISDQGALADIDSGNVDGAILKCCKIWASLPGAGYGQPEQKYPALRNAYELAGGTIGKSDTPQSGVSDSSTA